MKIKKKKMYINSLVKRLNIVVSFIHIEYLHYFTILYNLAYFLYT